MGRGQTPTSREALGVVVHLPETTELTSDSPGGPTLAPEVVQNRLIFWAICGRAEGSDPNPNFYPDVIPTDRHLNDVASSEREKTK